MMLKLVRGGEAFEIVQLRNVEKIQLFQNKIATTLLEAISTIKNAISVCRTKQGCNIELGRIQLIPKYSCVLGVGWNELYVRQKKCGHWPGFLLSCWYM